MDNVVSDLTAAEGEAMVGPIIIGHFVGVALWGMLMTTFANFLGSTSWTRTNRFMRVVVSGVVLLTTASTALYIKDGYSYATNVTMTVDYVESGDIASATQLPLLAVISTTTQTILVLRASRIITSNRWRWAYLTGFGSLLLLQLLAAGFNSVYEIHYALIVDNEYYIGMDWTTAIQLWMFTAASIDILISATYCYNLTRRLGGVTRTVGADNILRLIVRLVLQSAMPTAMLAIGAAAVTAAYPGFDLMTEDIYYAFWIPLPALYSLSLFTTLSIRERVTANLGNHSGQAFSLPVARPMSPPLQGVRVDFSREMKSERVEEEQIGSRSRQLTSTLMSSNGDHGRLVDPEKQDWGMDERETH